MCLSCDNTGFIKRTVRVSPRAMYGSQVREGTPLIVYDVLERCSCSKHVTYQLYQAPAPSANEQV
jgi:hypothetical protein